MTGAPIYLPIWWLFLPSSLGAVPAGAIVGQIIYQGVVVSVLTGFLYTTAVTRIGPASTTLVGALVPGVVAIVAWPLLDEPLGLLGIAGVVLAMAGMALGVWRGR